MRLRQPHILPVMAALLVTASCVQAWSRVAADTTYCYDVHATILHLLGIDHEKLTFRHAGRDFRLTDVMGRVVKEVLA